MSISVEDAKKLNLDEPVVLVDPQQNKPVQGVIKGLQENDDGTDVDVTVKYPTIAKNTFSAKDLSLPGQEVVPNGQGEAPEQK
jgi:hypothetical protein